MKVFLSHSSKDDVFVRKLAAQLFANEFEPWLCEYDIEISANFVDKINDGLTQSDVALLIWSPEAAESAWTRIEWTSALARQVEESRIRLAVILLKDHPLPELLRTSNRIDVQSDWDAGIDSTLQWLKSRKLAGRFGGSQKNVFLPYRPLDFVGREQYLSKLHRSISGDPASFLLFGEPGVGKSTLAIEIAWEVQKDFDAVVFQACERRPVDVITVELGERLNLGVKNLEPQKQRAEIRLWLADRRSLLILDDVWSSDVEQLIPGPAASVLCTSRRNTFPWIYPGNALHIDGFSESEATALFKAYLGSQAIETHRVALIEFGRRVEWMPLAIALGSTILGRTYDPLDHSAFALKPQDLAIDGKGRSIPNLLQAAITTLPETEQRFLVACAVCASEEFWLPLAVEVAGLEAQDGGKARDALINSSLLRLRSRERQRSQLHALLREQCQRQAIFSKLKDRYVCFIETLFGHWEQRWQECGECFSEVIPVLTALAETGANDRIAKLGTVAFAAAHRAGNLEAALRIIDAERSYWKKQGDQSASDNLQRSFGNEALVRRLWGDLDAARGCLETQERICNDTGNLAGLADCYANQALVIKAQWRDEQLRVKNTSQEARDPGRHVIRAMELLHQAMLLRKKEERIRIDLNQRKELAYCYGNQALIALEVSRAQPQPSHEDLKSAMQLSALKQSICTELNDTNGLQIAYEIQAAVLIDQNHLDKAEELLTKKLQLAQDIGNKWGIAYSHLNLAVVAQKKKLGSRAIGHAEEALNRFTNLKMASQIREVSSLLREMKSEFGGINRTDV